MGRAVGWGANSRRKDEESSGGEPGGGDISGSGGSVTMPQHFTHCLFTTVGELEEEKTPGLKGGLMEKCQAERIKK